MRKIELPGLHHLMKRDFPLAVSRITDAFDEDPCLKYLLDSDYYDPKKAKYIHEYSVKLGYKYGMIITTGEKVEGVSIWMPPNRVETTSWMFLNAGGLWLKKNVHAQIIKLFQKYGDYSSSIHHNCIREPHWYLLSIAVGKEYQGKGFANKLMNPVLSYFDTNNYPCFLETHNPRNVLFYEKFGFKVAEIGQLPDSDKTHWAMVRYPEKKTDDEIE